MQDELLFTFITLMADLDNTASEIKQFTTSMNGAQTEQPYGQGTNRTWSFDAKNDPAGVDAHK